MMNRIGNKWTEDEEQRMILGFQKGKTLEDMAKDHQRTPKAMEMRRDSLLRKLSPKASVQELGQLFHMDPRDVKEVLASAPPPPTPSSSKEKESSFKEVLARLDKLETLLEKIYKRIKNMEK
jgi:hypothetical protein